MIILSYITRRTLDQYFLRPNPLSDKRILERERAWAFGKIGIRGRNFPRYRSPFQLWWPFRLPSLWIGGMRILGIRNESQFRRLLPFQREPIGDYPPPMSTSKASVIDCRIFEAFCFGREIWLLCPVSSGYEPSRKERWMSPRLLPMKRLFENPSNLECFDTFFSPWPPDFFSCP